jgi:hypothetical protein
MGPGRRPTRRQYCRTYMSSSGMPSRSQQSGPIDAGPDGVVVKWYTAQLHHHSSHFRAHKTHDYDATRQLVIVLVREVGHGIADRAELPVENSEHLRLCRMEHDVVQSIVAVNNGRGYSRVQKQAKSATRRRRNGGGSAFVGRQMGRKPAQQKLHGRIDQARFARGVLLRPALDLPRKVVARSAKVLQSESAMIQR